MLQCLSDPLLQESVEKCPGSPSPFIEWKSCLLFFSFLSCLYVCCRICHLLIQAFTSCFQATGDCFAFDYFFQVPVLHFSIAVTLLSFWLLVAGDLLLKYFFILYICAFFSHFLHTFDHRPLNNGNVTCHVICPIRVCESNNSDNGSCCLELTAHSELKRGLCYHTLLTHHLLAVSVTLSAGCLSGCMYWHHKVLKQHPSLECSEFHCNWCFFLVLFEQIIMIVM